MVQINFKRLLAKKEVLHQVHGMIGLLQQPVAIYDGNQKILLGSVETKGKSFFIEVEGDRLGYVVGEDQAETLAEFLKFLCEREMRNRSLAQETLDKYRETAIIYDISEKLAARLDLEEVTHLVVEETKRLLHADHVTILYYDEKNQGFLGNKEKKSSKGIASFIAKSQKAEIINDVQKDPRFVESHRKISSMICVPLLVNDHVLGTLNVCARDYYQYTSNDLKILSAIAFQAAIAIENAQLYESLEDAFMEMVYALSEAIDKRDEYTGGHNKRVMSLSMLIGNEMALSKDDLCRLRLGAALHDIGKIGVRDDVLLKEGALSREEFEKIKRHPVYGYEILRHIKHLEDVLPAIRQHHERVDGSGYPDRAKTEDIDITARIIAVADSYDAMTTDRPYRKGMSHQIAIHEIKNNAGIQFDEQVVTAFESAWRHHNIQEEDECQNY